MFESLALEVTIGLVFIFLLYSLLATIFMEIAATFFGLRARNLRKAISRMLDDDQPPKNLGKLKLLQYFGLLFKGFLQFLRPKHDASSNKLYEQPVIKLLSEGHFFSKPSYLKATQFSLALIMMLKEKGRGITTRDQLTTILNDPEDKVLGGTTKKHLRILWENANQNLEKFVNEIESWFDDTMERASSWYKRDSQAMLLAIGFVLAVAFNASTFDIIDVLSKDKDARAKLVQLAELYVHNNDSITQPNQSDSLKLDSLLSIKRELQSDINEANSLLGLGWDLPELLNSKMIKEEEWINYRQNPKYGRIQNIRDVDGKIRKTDSIFVALFPNISFARRFTGVFVIEEGKSANKFVARRSASGIMLILQCLFSINFFGYLLTGLAVSLGAPFWFDLLNKIVSLRSSIRPKKEEPDPINKPASSNIDAIGKPGIQDPKVADPKVVDQKISTNDTYEVTPDKDSDLQEGEEDILK